MKALLTLIRREARDARLSLIAAPLVSAVVLGVIHAVVPGPTAVSEAALLASAILMSLWSLYFAADLFAADFASGRLATTALLPVRAATLWTAKVAFLVLTLSGLAAFVIALELGFQVVCETPASLAHLLDRLPAYLIWLPALLFTASAAALFSLLTEGALAAMLLALCFVGALWGISIPLLRAFETVGVILRPDHLLAALVIGAAVLLGVSSLAFSRGQRRLGSRRVRATFALASLAALLATGGAASAAEILHRGAMELEDPRVDVMRASASPDGRWLVLETLRNGGNVAPHPSIWMLDLKSGARHRITRFGSVLADPLGRGVFPWNADGSILCLTRSLLPVVDSCSTIRVRPHGSELTVEPADDPDPRNWRYVPPWAAVDTRSRPERRDQETTVTWEDRDVSVEFTGSAMEVALGRGLVLAPTAGILLRNRAGSLVRVDLATGAETVLVASGVRFLQPSPDGEAVLVVGDERTDILRVDDGAPLHAPIPKDLCPPSWIPGGVDHRALLLVGSDQRKRVLDLESGREFSVETNGWPRIFGLGENGYALVAPNQDFVQIDREGHFLRTLIDRDGR